MHCKTEGCLTNHKTPRCDYDRMFCCDRQKYLLGILPQSLEPMAVTLQGKWNSADTCRAQDLGWKKTSGITQGHLI